VRGPPAVLVTSHALKSPRARGGPPLEYTARPAAPTSHMSRCDERGRRERARPKSTTEGARAWKRKSPSP
jgi:hypothetical protein